MVEDEQYFSYATKYNWNSIEEMPKVTEEVTTAESELKRQDSNFSLLNSPINEPTDTEETKIKLDENKAIQKNV